jgi:hypothetical protein
MGKSYCHTQTTKYATASPDMSRGMGLFNGLGFFGGGAVGGGGSVCRARTTSVPSAVFQYQPNPHSETPFYLNLGNFWLTCLINKVTKYMLRFTFVSGRKGLLLGYSLKTTALAKERMTV